MVIVDWFSICVPISLYMQSAHITIKVVSVNPAYFDRGELSKKLKDTAGQCPDTAVFSAIKHHLSYVITILLKMESDN